MSLESVNTCPVCNDSTFQNFIKARDYTTTKEEFQIQQCANCNFLFTNPRPDSESIGKYYQSENYISHSGKSNLFGSVYRMARRYALQSKYNLITKYHQSRGSILDFGCGTGELLKYFHERNWKITGIEPSTIAREKASILTGENIYPSIDQANQSTYDVITLWHVLEHIHNLNETITSIKEKLKPEGTLFIAVPNPASKDCKHYQENWAGYDVPRHLWHFSRETIQKLLKNHGLKIVEIIPMKLDSFYVSLLSENYTHQKRNKFINALSAFTVGLKSNLLAKKTGEYSSLIYIIQSE
jgi:2-polyprenyl-3-methyl-5-hydroxy-6-metoxy-1,4-benzoquinol methylase